MARESRAERSQREQLQADWFRGLRSAFLRRSLAARRGPVLDLGCGSGVVTRELVRRTRGPVVALDCDPALFSSADAHAGALRLVADAEHLPFPDESIDLALTQMLFMWTGSASERVASELYRVLRPRGVLLAVAEPDYGGVLDHPPEAASLSLLESALERQGAATRLGRRLPGLLVKAGFRTEAAIHAGTLPGTSEVESAARVSFIAAQADLDAEARERLLKADRAACARGARFVFVPYVAVYCTKSRVRSQGGL